MKQRIIACIRQGWHWQQFASRARRPRWDDFRLQTSDRISKKGLVRRAEPSCRYYRRRRKARQSSPHGPASLPLMTIEGRRQAPRARNTRTANEIGVPSCCSILSFRFTASCTFLPNRPGWQKTRDLSFGRTADGGLVNTWNGTKSNIDAVGAVDRDNCERELD